MRRLRRLRRAKWASSVKMDHFRKNFLALRARALSTCLSCIMQALEARAWLHFAERAVTAACVYIYLPRLRPLLRCRPWRVQLRLRLRLVPLPRLLPLLRLRLPLRLRLRLRLSLLLRLRPLLRLRLSLLLRRRSRLRLRLMLLEDLDRRGLDLDLLRPWVYGRPLRTATDSQAQPWV